MRESSDGRDTVFPWSDAPTALPGPCPYAVGDVVYSGKNPEPGTVVSVDATAGTFAIIWRNTADFGAIVYPIDASYLRKAFPWELK
jgi:hypothetical protein